MASTERSVRAVGATPDRHLPVAGLGGRSYAFLLDWHIRILAGLAWYAASIWVQDRHFIPSETDPSFWSAAVAPALVIYLFYHPGFEILTANTPGKRLAGVRIVDRDGRRPGIVALIVRNALRPVDSLVFYVVGMASVLITRQAVRIGDLAAGTVLVYADGLDPRHADLRGVDSNGTDKAPDATHRP